MLEVGSLVELDIVDAAYGGEFIARYEDLVVFVRGAIIGEKVIAQITKQQAKLCRAIVREVIKSAPNRIVHPWPLGAVEATGAADYGHIKLSGQREMKSRMLANQLRRIAGAKISAQFSAQMLQVESVEFGRDGGLRGNPDAQGWHYRTRIDVLKLDTGVGMHLLRTNQLIALQEMPLATRRLDELDLFAAAWDKYVPPKTRMRLVAPSASPVIAVIDGKTYREPGMLVDPKIKEVVQYRGKSYEYKIAAGSFWQIHENAPNSLVAHVFDGLELQPGDRLVDLYSGSGLFSLIGADLVGQRGSVRSYEGDQRATLSAQENLRAMPWAKAEAVNIRAENIAKLVAGADFVIADPPRAGLGVDAAQELAKSQAKKIALVSCDAASMARDVSAMLAAGRKLDSFTAVDIFPNTHYVETVCIFS
ncbi:class I SAM-dependent RNA methyltransferase [Arcanobacterium hippocoleae]|uniref:tRNA/tmRNA/rRNA uracil-C5-methylase (TrmA/RlmC/RlmD family) n=1 Tax=Arcanobacterium hippocoleae TaxID=149017 RepID=A0ABU1T0J3_9ACTO|nr:TRAM domain-containing protein [Arcanobacterium hippocoleae]MDR6938848.1 tRNA/tmRNA/rRNA uracil-C5-methylase (TrmA/RlmC/RlmD family) [Arcanobacterium hippocoleae]